MSAVTENQRVARQMVRFMVMFETPSDIEAFERHYREVHIPLARQLPGLRRYTVSHDPMPVVGAPYYAVAMLDWDDMESLNAAFESAAGKRTADDAITNLSPYATTRGMIVQLDDK